MDTERALAHAWHMLEAGCDGVTLFGTTGEGPAFTLSERTAFLDAALQSGIAADRLIVTITALALGDVIALGRHAAALGVKRQMLMPAFYFNQPSDDGVVGMVSAAVQGIADPQLQLLLYHFPAMSTYAFSHAAIARLVALHPQQVVGVKDSGGDLSHALALVKAFPTLSILVGTEPHVAQVMCAGGAGSINGLSNIAPALMRRIVDKPRSVSASDDANMAALLALLAVRPGMPFVSVYKTMLAEQTGDDFWCNVRLPLCPLDNTEAQAVRQGYRALGNFD